MNPNNYYYNTGYKGNFNPTYQQVPYDNQDERLIGGGFAFPFLLGGVTGAAIAPAFFGGYNRPYYNNYYYPPYRPPYPYPPRPPYPRPY